MSFLLKGAFRQSTEGGQGNEITEARKALLELTINHPQHRDGVLNRGGEYVETSESLSENLDETSAALGRSSIDRSEPH